jgi:hypothetical protein
VRAYDAPTSGGVISSPRRVKSWTEQAANGMARRQMPSTTALIPV